MNWIIPAALVVLFLFGALLFGARYPRRPPPAGLRRRWQSNLTFDLTFALNTGAVAFLLLLFGGIVWLEFYHRRTPPSPTPPLALAAVAVTSPAGTGTGRGGAVPVPERGSTQPPQATTISTPTATIVPTRTATPGPPEPTLIPPATVPPTATRTPRLAAVMSSPQAAQPSPTSTATVTATPLPSSTATRLPPSPTPVPPSPTVAPPVATPTPTPPVAVLGVTPPELLAPTDGLRISGAYQRFSWQPTSSLPRDARYVLEVWPYDGQPRALATLADSRWAGTLDGAPGIYHWRVRIVSPGEDGDVEQAVSETYTFSWQP